MNWYLKVMKQYVDFGGRARRKEYWMFFLVYFLITLVGGVIEGVLSMPGTITTVLFLVHLLPWLSATVRRLHDTDRSGWWILLAFSSIFGFLVATSFSFITTIGTVILVYVIPPIATLVLLFFMVQSGDTQSNRFGADPKAS